MQENTMKYAPQISNKIERPALVAQPNAFAETPRRQNLRLLAYGKQTPYNN
jgi:hypothetical protein